MTCAVALVATLLAAAPAAAQSLEAVTSEFEAVSGARLLFTRAELGRERWYTIMMELPPQARAKAAAIALREVKRYPPGYLKAIGLRRVGLFAGLAAKTNDGFHEWRRELGGFAYLGMWNHRDGLVAAAYSEEQLVRTLHHEIFHHVDSTRDGRMDDARHAPQSSAAFAAALQGRRPYAAISLGEEELAALRERATGEPLVDAASRYCSKSPREDRAETARWVMAHLPEALLQAATRPELKGSQRILHVLRAFELSAKGAPDLGWLRAQAMEQPGRREARQ